MPADVPSQMKLNYFKSITIPPSRRIEYVESGVWLLDDGVADSFSVGAEFVTLPAVGLLLTVTVVRPTKDVAQFRFGTAWSAEESRA